MNIFRRLKNLWILSGLYSESFKIDVPVDHIDISAPGKLAQVIDMTPEVEID